jgi:hypothetical protein
MDALQYAALAAHGGMVQGAILRRMQAPVKRQVRHISPKAWT